MHISKTPKSCDQKIVKMIALKKVYKEVRIKVKLSVLYPVPRGPFRLLGCGWSIVLLQKPGSGGL